MSEHYFTLSENYVDFVDIKLTSRWQSSITMLVLFVIVFLRSGHNDLKSQVVPVKRYHKLQFSFMISMAYLSKAKRYIMAEQGGYIATCT